jgi:transcriptional regulator with XRE-family HTH domain
MQTELEVRNILKNARESRGFSRGKLASMVGATQADIYQIENGQVDITITIVDELASALDINWIQELYSRVKSMERLQYYNERSTAALEHKKMPKAGIFTCVEEIKRERKNARAQLLLKKTTKLAIVKYAKEYGVSLNDTLHGLIDAFLFAQDNEKEFIEYNGIMFTLTSENNINRSERKTESTQLLLKESTKNRIQQIAKKNDISMNDIVQRVAESFLREIC